MSSSIQYSDCDEVLIKMVVYAVHNRALHIAVRKPDFPVVLQLLRLGADPLLVNSEHRTPLQLIAIKVSIHCYNQIN